jgi:hypothetical protein
VGRRLGGEGGEAAPSASINIVAQRPTVSSVNGVHVSLLGICINVIMTSNLSKIYMLEQILLRRTYGILNSPLRPVKYSILKWSRSSEQFMYRQRGAFL